mmetsp:Transcript_43983/g.99866  ORF Transcript_43983/g.99866 Transcript_43983/m.99866 type:complete len:260 (-) Transcript_43983:363-1142(-)
MRGGVGAVICLAVLQAARICRWVDPDLGLPVVQHLERQLLQVDAILVHDLVEERPAEAARDGDRGEARQRGRQDDGVGAYAGELQDDHHRRQREAEAGRKLRHHAEDDARRHDVGIGKVQDVARYSAHKSTNEAATNENGLQDVAGGADGHCNDHGHDLAQGENDVFPDLHPTLRVEGLLHGTGPDPPDTPEAGGVEDGGANASDDERGEGEDHRERPSLATLVHLVVQPPQRERDEHPEDGAEHAYRHSDKHPQAGPE